MGNCCLKEENGNNTTQSRYNHKLLNNETHIRSKTLYNISTIPKKKSLNKITSEEVDNQILNWVEKTKHFHKKTSSLNYNGTINEVSFDEDEITKAFNEENINMIKTFSELTSTIHLTNLTRDFYMSKIKANNFNTLNNNSISNTFFNVLEELEKNFPSENNDSEPIKIIISNHNSKRKNPHLSLNLDYKYDNTYLSENNNLCLSENIYVHKSLFSNNSSKENNTKSKIGDEYSQTNINNFFKQSTDNARLFSQGFDFSSTMNNDNISINVNNIFVNVEKKNIDFYYKKYNKFNFEHENLNIKGVLISNFKNNTLSIVNYPMSFYKIIIDWKKNENLNYLNFDFRNINSNLDNIFFSFGIFQDSGLLSAFFSIIKHDIDFKSNFFSNFIKINNNGYCSFTFFINGSIKYTNLDNLLPFINNEKDNEKLFFSFISNSVLQKLINYGEKLFYLLSNKLTLNFSNSMFYLTGWIPENFNLKTEHIEQKSFWTTLFTNYSNGNLFFSFFYKDSNDVVSKKNKMLSNLYHSIYKNIYYIIVSMDNENKTIKMKPSFNEQLYEDNIISLTFNDACSLFTHIYLNWNPDIFKYCYKFNSNFIHNSSYYSNSYNEDYSLEYNPQFILEIPKHNENIEIKIFIEKFINENSIINDDISYKLFRYEGYMKIYPEDDLRNYQKEKGNIASDTLFFEPSEVDEQFLIVILKKEKNNCKSEISVKFSLNIFSQSPLKICEIPKRILYLKEKVISKWNDNQLFDYNQIELLYDNFLKFPQFKLTLNSIENNNYIQIILETFSFSNIMIFFLENNGKTLLNTSIGEFKKKNHQNFFFNSFSYLEIKDLPDGDYTIICINSDEKKLNKEFCLQVNSLSENTKNIQLMRLNPIPKYQNIEKVIGQWTKINYKKIEIPQDFYIYNFPSYEFEIKNKNICCFFLKDEKKINDNESLINSLDIYLKIYKKDKINNTFKLVYNGQNGFCSLWGFFINNLELDLGKYIITCVNKSITNNSKYKLIIQSLSPIYNLRIFNN